VGPGRAGPPGPLRPGLEVGQLAHGWYWKSLATLPTQVHAMDLIHRIGGGGQTCFVLMRSLLHDLASSPSKNAYINRSVRRRLGQTYFVRSRCPVSEVSFLRSFSTTQTGEALSAHTLHHRYHTVVLSIPSTTPPYLAGPGRRSRWCAVRVHLSKASPLAALDQIGSRGGEG
jgi:hypothetical protein